MSKFHSAINEVSRAAATVLLSATIGAAFFVVAGGKHDAGASVKVEAEATQGRLPDRPAGGRRWRSSNAEQSQSLLRYYGEDNPWNRHRAKLEGAMSLFEIGSTFPSKNLAQGTLRVTVTEDHLSAYLATPFLGGDAAAAFAINETIEQGRIEIGPVLARAFRAELLAQQ
jgi:hypothetical protein